MICAIILAAGNSSRFNSQTPKQFHQLNGQLLLDYPIQTFSKCNEIDQLIIVVAEKQVDAIKKVYPQYNVISGGHAVSPLNEDSLLLLPPGTT